MLIACEADEAQRSYAVRLVEPHTLPVPARSYNSGAWLRSGTIALSHEDERTRVMVIDLVGPDGTQKGVVDMGRRPECGYRDFMTLARLPTGELGLADVCAVFQSPEPESAEFKAVDLDTAVVRSLGGAIERPYSIAWKEDMTAVYATGNDLCVTLYVHAERETPLNLEVVVDGQRFEAGQDITATPDHCPSGGRAARPAYSPDGRTLAFMASANGATVGQDLIDVPWTTFVSHDDGPALPVLGGVRYPGDMVWLSDGSTLVFAGNLGGRQGLWRVTSAGSELTLLAKINALHMALAPDGTQLVALLAPAAGKTTNDVVIVDLPNAE
ncbi:MAG TPA: hypothetical protein VGQ47_04720 [Candidatus Limnocylindrales bacterium]|nr:hypothetical protein [Candidatus Limnocylindrales bacterium]